MYLWTVIWSQIDKLNRAQTALYGTNGKCVYDGNFQNELQIIYGLVELWKDFIQIQGKNYRRTVKLDIGHETDLQHNQFS